MVLLDLASIENKGDPAIGLGQLYLLGMLGLEVVYYCDYFCRQADFDRGRDVARMYREADVVVMSTGGGNFGGYPFNDHQRIAMLRTFSEYQFVLLSQSTWFHDDGHLKKCITEYSRHPRLTILLRDEPSYNFTRDHFPLVRAILAPDMVLNIGHVPRFMPPLYDVVWVQRGDEESPGRSSVQFPPGISFRRHDWFHTWPSPKGQNLIDDTIAMTYNGLMFLQRGRVVVTDRLHGFILSQLLDLPTVIIDNRIKKISSYRNTWASNLEKVVTAANGTDAVEKATLFLQKYSASLPEVHFNNLF